MSLSIAYKELFPVVLAASLWGHEWSTKQVQFCVDNTAVVKVLWSGTLRDLRDSVCSQFQKAQAREPMIVRDPPDRPWSRIGSDLFEFNGIHYLLSVDYYSKWIELAKLDDLTCNNVICHLKSQFARYGIPD